MVTVSSVLGNEVAFVSKAAVSKVAVTLASILSLALAVIIEGVSLIVTKLALVDTRNANFSEDILFVYVSNSRSLQIPMLSEKAI